MVQTSCVTRHGLTPPLAPTDGARARARGSTAALADELRADLLQLRPRAPRSRAPSPTSAHLLPGRLARRPAARAPSRSTCRMPLAFTYVPTARPTTSPAGRTAASSVSGPSCAAMVTTLAAAQRVAPRPGAAPPSAMTCVIAPGATSSRSACKRLRAGRELLHALACSGSCRGG